MARNNLLRKKPGEQEKDLNKMELRKRKGKLKLGRSRGTVPTTQRRFNPVKESEKTTPVESLGGRQSNPGQSERAAFEN